MDTTETTPSPEHAPRAVAELTDEIAAHLGETESGPRKTIKRAVRILGPVQVQALLDRTLEIERTGGLLLPDGSRRRTPGGVFFYLIRTTVAPKEAYKIVRPSPPPLRYNRRRRHGSPRPSPRQTGNAHAHGPRIS